MEQSLRTNDTAARIVKKHADTVFRVAFARTGSRADAEDIMQEVFLRFIRRAPAFESAEHEKAWFIRAAINCSNTLLGSAWRRRTVPYCESTGGACPAESTGRATEAVAKLPENMRIAVHLFYYEDLPVAKIAEITGKTQVSVKTTLSRARKKLKEILTEE